MSNDKKEMQPMIRTIYEIGYKKNRLSTEELEKIILSQNFNLYRIIRDNFKVFYDSKRSALELLAEFDSISGELTKFSGWLEVAPDNESYINVGYAEISLNPVKMKNGLIYHFKGTLEWKENYDGNNDFKERTVPLSVIPLYGIPSGQIIKLQPVKIGDSLIFDGADIEYRLPGIGEL